MAGYTRTDTTNNIADGNIINATDLDNEFDGIQAAFNSSTGHNHDGTTGEGAPILVLGPTQDVVVGATTVTPKTTNTVDIGSSSLKFKDLHMAGNALVGGTLGVTGIATFTAQPVLSSLTASRAVFTDGSKGLVSNAITGTGNVVMSASPTLTGTIGGENATLSGTLAVTGVATFTAQPIVSSLTASRAVFSDGSKGLVSNAITGTGNVVMSASPTLTGTVVVADLTDSSLTAGRVTYAGTGGNLVDSTNLTFNGTTLSAAGLSDSGNLTFTGTGNRIIGDFSNATLVNSVSFQTSTANNNTNVQAIPSGTGTASQYRVYNNSDPTNAAFGQFFINASENRIASQISGTGTYLPMTFFTGGSERVRIDTSGNVGIGTSSPIYPLQIVGSLGYAATNQFTDDSLGGGFVTAKGRGTVASPSAVLTGDSIGLFSAGGYNSSSVAYNKAAMQMYAAENWTTTANGAYLTFATTAIGATGRSERMRIDSSGNVGIGTSSPTSSGAGYTVLHVNNATSGGQLHLTGGGSGAAATDGAILTQAGVELFINNQEAGPTLFYNNGSERARITSIGDLLVGATVTGGARFYSVADSASQGSGYFRNTATSGITSDQVQIGVSQGSGTGYHFIRAYSSVFTTPAVQFAVRGDGTVYAQNTTIQSLSDARVKENVRDSSDGLATITALRPVRFDFKEGHGNNRKNQLGFIAQEVEVVFPDAVDIAGDKDENGDPYKSVGPGALIPVLVKAIQELKAEFDAYKSTHP